VLHVFHQGSAAGAVHGSDTGDQGIDEAIEFAGEYVQKGHKTALTKTVQSHGTAVGCLQQFTESAGIQGVVFPRHDLYRLRCLDILQDPDVGGDALIGKGMDIALLLVRKKGQDIRPQYIGMNDDDRFPILTGGDAFIPGKDLIQDEPVRLRRLYVTAVVEVEAEFAADILDCFGVTVDDAVGELNQSGGVFAYIVFFLTVEAVEQGHEGLGGFLPVEISQTVYGALHALLGDLKVELHQFVIVGHALKKESPAELFLFQAVEALPRRPEGNHEIGEIRHDTQSVKLAGLEDIRGYAQHFFGGLG